MNTQVPLSVEVPQAQPEARDPGAVIERARWIELLPHEGTLEVVFRGGHTAPLAREARKGFDEGLERRGFRRGAGHLPAEYVAARWAPVERALIERLAQEALALLASRLGVAPLDPLPEVLSHSDPLARDALTASLRLRLHPAPPDPMAVEEVWPPNPTRGALQAAQARAAQISVPTPPEPLRPPKPAGS